MSQRRIRLGMVGGGRGSFIGAIHRAAAALDGQFELMAAAPSSDPDNARLSGAELGLANDRIYESWEDMAARESARPDGIEAVSIVTPNHLHCRIATCFLNAGMHVICDKPLTTSLEDARELAAREAAGAPLLFVTYNYSGYAMVRQARAMVAAGDVGEIRVVQVEYPQGWLSEAVEKTSNKQAEWRTDPARAGEGGSIGDIGTHAYHLLRFVTGLEMDSVAAQTSRFVAGRRLDDDAQVLLRFRGAARGMLWVSQVAIGEDNALKLRVYGDCGSLVWSQERPDELRYCPLNAAPILLRRGGEGLLRPATRATRLPAGHPEGFLEAFATIYSDAAHAIECHRAGQTDPDCLTPRAGDGLEGMEFVHAVVESSRLDGAWVPLPRR